jgi:FkbM family methyltransferase
MTFISYAQNFEDVMLWRALKHVSEGFYIDVGAQDPDIDSVTHAFYDRGWHGVNVEPTEVYFVRLAAARPRDINLRLALGEAPGESTLFMIPGTGLSTLSAEIATQHGENGYVTDEICVEMATLAEICRRYARSDIHFLKIDVEGAEHRVLAGADFSVFRPWILVLESTRPLSQEEGYAAWEPSLLAAEYRFVWFDGVNRFYVAAERYDELAGHFRAPPNFFDGFQRAAENELLQKWQRAEARAAEASQQTVAAEARVVAAEARVEAMRTSLSWRVTRPFRRLHSRLTGLSRWKLRF